MLIVLVQNVKMSQLMRLWYLSYMQPAKAVSPEPSLFEHIKYRSRLRIRPTIRHAAPLDGCPFAFEECVYGGRKVPLSHEMAKMSVSLNLENSRTFMSVDSLLLWYFPLLNE